MKLKSARKIILLSLLVILLMYCCSACKKASSVQDQLAEIIIDRFIDIDQFPSDEHTMSLSDAEAILYCWADTNSGEAISEDELRKAIWIVLESTDAIRDLIYGINSIDIG